MKPAIFILHGWESRVEKWRPLKEELEGVDFEVFLPELPGFGETPPPERAWGVSDYAQWVKERLPKDYFLVGHSFGGRIAIKIAARNPKGLAGLILIDSAGIRPRKQLKRCIFWFLAKSSKILFLLPPFCFFKSCARWMLYKLVGERDYYRAQGVMRMTFKKVVAEDLKKTMKKIKIPTLILWGERDKITPLSDGRLMNSLIKNSLFKIFSDTGHDLPLKFPQKTARQIVKFCQRNQ